MKQPKIWVVPSKDLKPRPDDEDRTVVMDAKLQEALVRQSTPPPAAKSAPATNDGSEAV